MKKLYQSKFQIINLLEEDSIIMSQWTPDTAQMTSADHLFELHSLFMYIRKFNPKKFLSDIRELKFELSEDAQAFSARLFKDNAASYISIVCSPDPHIESSVDGAFEKFDDLLEKKVLMAYFKDTNPAINWLKSCQ